MTSNLTSGYHRDYQLLKEVLFPAIEQIRSCLQISTLAIGQLQINQNLLDDEKYDYLYSVEVVNAYVLKGLPFRDAYQKVAQQIQEETFEKPASIQHTHLGSIGNLANEQIQAKLEEVWKDFEFEILEAKLKALVYQS